MASSPQSYAWERPSSALSQYTIDLGPLDSDSHSDTLAKVARPILHRVTSQDIDGPSDFTQNLDMWMKGGTATKCGPATLASLDRSNADTIVTLNAQENVEDVLELRSRRSSQAQFDLRTESHHTPEHSPPRESVWSRLSSSSHPASVWRTGQAPRGSTPTRSAHGMLPVMLEDDPEENPSANDPRHSYEGEQSLGSNADVQAASAGIPLAKPERSSVAAGLANSLTTPGTSTSALDAHWLTANLRALQSKCLQLEGLNSALANALEKERKLREEANAAQNVLQVPSLGHEEGATQPYQGNGIRLELKALQEELLEQRIAASAARLERDEADGQRDSSLQLLRQQLEQQALEHTRELSSLKQDLDVAQRDRESAVEAIGIRRKEADHDKAMFELRLQGLQAELNAVRSRSGSNSPNDRAPGFRSKVQHLETALATSEESVRVLRHELRMTQEKLAAENRYVSDNRDRALKRAEALGQKLLDTKTQNEARHASQQAEIKRLRTEHHLEMDKLKRSLSSMNTELDETRTTMNQMILDRDDAQDARDVLAADSQASKTELAILRESNGSLDAKISSAFQKREQSWRQKVDKLEQERRVMVKALMHQWGREELGIRCPQAYAYERSSNIGVVKSKDPY